MLCNGEVSFRGGCTMRSTLLAALALSRLLLTDTQAIVRLHATMALGRLGPAARAAIPKLAKDTINDKSSWEIRKTAAQALGSIALDRENGPDAQTVGALTRAIHGQYADVC